jgi:hypothetical protein
MRKKWMAIVLLLAATILFFPLYPAGADDAAPVDEAADLAQDLTNPLADLMTIPIQMNYDQDIGAGDGGERLRTNIQPVIPFHLNEDWNLISRTILPVVYQDDIFPGEGSQFGLGDTSLSLFLSPKKPTATVCCGVSARFYSCQRPRIRCSAARSGVQGPPRSC